MDVLTRITDDVIVAFGDLEERAANKRVQDLTLGHGVSGLVNVDFYLFEGIVQGDLPQDVQDNASTVADAANMLNKQYIYTTVGGFETNINYVEPIYLEEYVRENRDRIKVLEDKMDIAVPNIQDLLARVDALENP